MEKMAILRALVSFVLWSGGVVSAQAQDGIPTILLPLPSSLVVSAVSPPPTSTVTSWKVPFSRITPRTTTTATGKLPIKPGSFTPCWGTTVTNRITWDVSTTVFTNITVIPHITPFADGTNITSYETITAADPAPTAFLSTTMFNGSVCVAPTVCVEHLSQGCGSDAEKRLFRRIDSTGLTGSVPFTIPSTYITATSILETAYTAPPKIEPRVDPTSKGKASDPDPKPTASPSKRPSNDGNPKPTANPTRNPGNGDNPRPAPSLTPGNAQSAVNPLPPIISQILSPFLPPRPAPQPDPTAGKDNVSPNPRPGSPTIAPAPPAALPSGFSPLPSSAGVVVPGGQTLAPGEVITAPEVVITPAPGTTTTLSNVPISLAPDASFIAIGTSGGQIIPLAPSPTPAASPDLPSGVAVLPSGAGLLLPNGETLTPGAVTTVGGIPVSLSPSESVVVVDGSRTVDLAPGPSVTGGVVLPNGETLRPGVKTTISGVEVSLSPGETQVVVGGSTITVGPEQTGGAVASAVWSGIGAAATSSGSDGDEMESAKATSADKSATKTDGGNDAEPTGGEAAPSPSPSGGAAAERHVGRGSALAAVVGLVQFVLLA